METIKTIGKYALNTLAVIGLIALAMLIVYILVEIVWLFAEAGFKM